MLKLFFKYILIKVPHTFIYFKSQKTNIINLFITNNTIMFIILHIKLSTLFYTSQLSDILAYELPFIGSKINKNNLNVNVKPLTGTYKTLHPSIIIYNFHSIYSHNRIFLFTNHSQQITTFNLQHNYYNLASIAELFPAANWLERENSELHGINFIGKKDLRNLMLQYGDSSTPFNKSFPSIGTNDLIYNPINDTLNQIPISTQL